MKLHRNLNIGQRGERKNGNFKTVQDVFMKLHRNLNIGQRGECKNHNSWICIFLICYFELISSSFYDKIVSAV